MAEMEGWPPVLTGTPFIFEPVKLVIRTGKGKGGGELAPIRLISNTGKINPFLKTSYQNTA